MHLLDKAEIWVSPEILNEYRQVPIELEAEGKINHEQLKILIAGIASFVLEAKIAYPKKPISICRDIEDYMFLESCLTAKAELLITGDKDLVFNLLLLASNLLPLEWHIPCDKDSVFI